MTTFLIVYAFGFVSACLMSAFYTSPYDRKDPLITWILGTLLVGVLWPFLIGAGLMMKILQL